MNKIAELKRAKHFGALTVPDSLPRRFVTALFPCRPDFGCWA